MYTHSMQTMITKWGNSIGIRIPQTYAKDLGLCAGHPVELRKRGQHLEIIPLQEDLSSVLSSISPENLHAPVSWGRRRGREVW
mgnify:CR=1 FL=1